MGFLLIIQLKNILFNQTTIEYRVVHWARQMESFIYPYDLGLKENLLQVVRTDGDGLIWPVRAGCDQYTLAREQLRQKFEERQRAVRYRILRDYSGSFCPFGEDLQTWLSMPCLHQSRLSIRKDQYIFVTHWETHWLYGKSNKNLRGWFPRSCVDTD